MNQMKDKLRNILLYPTGLYARLTDRKATLYAGILLVGAIDLLLPDVGIMWKYVFSGKSANDVYINAFLLALLIAVLGLVDVIIVSIPLFDLFKYLKKKEKNMPIVNFNAESGNDAKDTDESLNGMEARSEPFVASSASYVKVMKIYILSHFLVVPVTTAAYYLFLRHITNSSPEWVIYAYLAFSMLIYIWSAAIMTRGINTLFRFNPIFARLTFIIVFTWCYVTGMVFEMQIMNWMLQLFH